MALSRSSRIFAVVLVAIVAAGIWGITSALEQVAGTVLPEPVEPGLPVEFTIDPGQSGQAIASNLSDQGVVDGNAFLDEIQSRGIAETLVPGDYELETGMDVTAVVDIIEAGPQVLRITVPEGLRVDQTLARLAEQTSFEHIDFVDVLDAHRHDPEASPLALPDWVPPLAELPDTNHAFEGLLWPATYDFDLEAAPAQIIQRLVDQAAAIMADVPEEEIAAAAEAGVSRYDALKIASLIEREARLPEDRPLIAGVIRNRMTEGMRLQIDAASEYAAAVDGAAEGSAYNLYEVDGLPPTPISGARQQALQVAFTPPDVTYRFYVLSDECDGSHVFADTLEEHEVNVAAYRAVGECE